MAALVATLLVLAPSSAEASVCGRDPGDQTAVEAAVAEVRAACPCDGFAGRGSFRRCARDRVKTAVASAELPSRCRATVIRRAGNRGRVCGLLRVRPELPAHRGLRRVVDRTLITITDCRL